MSESKLTACPYCGSDDCYVFPDISWFSVRCRGCGAEGPIKDTLAEAIAAWNRRYVCPDKNGDPVYAGDEVKCHVRRENRNDDDPEYDRGVVVFDKRGLLWRLKTGVFQKSIMANYDEIELIKEPPNDK